MALMDFIKKQFIDVIHWTEEGDGTLAWRYPMRDRKSTRLNSSHIQKSRMPSSA